MTDAPDGDTGGNAAAIAAAFPPPSVPSPHVIPTKGRNLSTQGKPTVIPSKEWWNYYQRG